MKRSGRPKAILKPYWQTTDRRLVRLYLGDVTNVLKRLPTGSVHTVVTSPPYWALRDYGTDKNYELGSEDTPEEYLKKMVRVFREIRRVLRDDGTLWLNLGDTYSGGKGGLVAIPWRVALALKEDGWILRQDIIWHKPSPIPEPARNRCTKAHEYIFLLTKKGIGYYYDAEAVKDKSETPWRGVFWREGNKSNSYKPKKHFNELLERSTANKRSVWTVASESYDGAHFATFPRKLIEPCILAGTSEKGCCSKCGAPWKRVVAKLPPTGGHSHGRKPGSPYALEKQMGLAEGGAGARWPVKTKGWKRGCRCKGSKIIPCTVLDPFIGSGTTSVVSLAHGRRSIGIDLSEEYLKNQAITRIVGALIDRPKLSKLAGVKSSERFDTLGDEITED